MAEPSFNIILNYLYPKHKFETLNYWAPLATPSQNTRRVRFTLPPQHHETISKHWRHKCAHRPTRTLHPCKINSSHHKSTHMSPSSIKQGIINGSIPSTVSDTSATSTAGTLHDPFINSNVQSALAHEVHSCLSK